MWKIILVAVLAILGGGYLLWSELSKSMKCTEETDAVITGTESRRVRHRHGSGRKYSPVVEFEAKGETVSGTADISSIFKGKFKPGTSIAVRYDPEDPTRFMIKGKSLRSGILSGAALLLIGAAGIWLALK